MITNLPKKINKIRDIFPHVTVEDAVCLLKEALVSNLFKHRYIGEFPLRPKYVSRRERAFRSFKVFISTESSIRGLNLSSLVAAAVLRAQQISRYLWLLAVIVYQVQLVDIDMGL